MKFLKHFRSRSRLSPQEELEPYPKPRGPDRLSSLPRPLLGRILTLVCPHTADDSYESCERSLIGDGCMLCDVRDLSQCALVGRIWNLTTQDVMYRSVRIDAVHYCSKEDDLSEQRRKKHIDPSEIPAIRLRLFQRTMRESSGLASKVLLLKIPYMTRESCKADLARTISMLPNIRYVDLPDAFFVADPSSQILRDELQAGCQDIRKMSYNSGSEHYFEALGQYCWWPNLESLHLFQIQVDPSVLCSVLASLPLLRDLKLREVPLLDDSIFHKSPNVAEFPPIRRLELENTPGITADGLAAYLSNPAARELLSFLSLTRTGVTISNLPSVLWAASHLIHLSVTDTVNRSLLLESLPPLTSLSLQTLHYEIASSESLHSGHTRPADSYYLYLASSLHANALPSLQKLYVRDSAFPETLLLTQPDLHLASDHGKLSSRLGGARQPPKTRMLNQTLEIYTKGVDELEWAFAPVYHQPPAIDDAFLPFQQIMHQRHQSSPGFKLPPTNIHHRGSSSGSVQSRPVSAYNASHGLGPQWGGEARKSIMVGNGQGGFFPAANEGLDDELPPAGFAGLNINPTLARQSMQQVDGGRSSGSGMLEVPRPRSPGGWPLGHGNREIRKSRSDLWR